MSNDLVFLKLGGSLITVKSQPHTPRLEVLERLAQEIAEAREKKPALQIVLGHGAGSFAHIPASHYHTRQGVETSQEWQGFIEVWRQAAELNQLVMGALEKADLPAMVLPASGSVIAQDGKVSAWNLEPLLTALGKGLLPVIYGDVVFDRVRGGTILSTEDLFTHLVAQLQPGRLLFAGIEAGVWSNFPKNTTLLKEITVASFADIEAGLSGSASTDVTGGMRDKVRQIMNMASLVQGLRATIFSGEMPGNVARSLLGEELGTVIHIR